MDLGTPHPPGAGPAGSIVRSRLPPTPSQHFLTPRHLVPVPGCGAEPGGRPQESSQGGRCRRVAGARWAGLGVLRAWKEHRRGSPGAQGPGRGGPGEKRIKAEARTQGGGEVGEGPRQQRGRRQKGWGLWGVQGSGGATPDAAGSTTLQASNRSIQATTCFKRPAPTFLEARGHGKWCGPAKETGSEQAPGGAPRAPPSTCLGSPTPTGAGARACARTG